MQAFVLNKSGSYDGQENQASVKDNSINFAYRNNSTNQSKNNELVINNPYFHGFMLNRDSIDSKPLSKKKKTPTSKNFSLSEDYSKTSFTK